MLEPLCGRPCGSIRKPCRGGVCKWHILRNAPRTMPAKDVFAVRLKETSENHATKKRCCGASYGSFRKTCKWHILRNAPRTMPAKDVFAVRLKETSENHATKKRCCGASYGSFRKTRRKRALLRHISRKTPHNEPRREQSADQFAEDSEKQTVLRPPRGRSCGRFRTIDREEGNLRHNTRKVPSNGAPQRQSAARRTEGSEKRAKEESRNGISYGSFRKTSRKQSAK